MPKIKVDGLEYNSEDLSDKALSVLKSLQFSEMQLSKLEADIAVYQTAQNSYKVALMREIAACGLDPISSSEPTNSDELS